MKHWMILLKTPIFIRFKNVGNLSLFRGNKNILWYENFNWNHANALLWFILVTRTWLSIVIWCYAAEVIWAVWRFLHVVDNDTLFDKETDKLAKIRPMIEARRNQCVKVTPEEYHSVGEQIIPSKTKRRKVRQYNPKKPQNLEKRKLLIQIPKSTKMRCCCCKALQRFASTS